MPDVTDSRAREDGTMVQEEIPPAGAAESIIAACETVALAVARARWDRAAGPGIEPGGQRPDGALGS